VLSYVSMMEGKYEEALGHCQAILEKRRVIRWPTTIVLARYRGWGRRTRRWRLWKRLSRGGICGGADPKGEVLRDSDLETVRADGRFWKLLERYDRRGR